MSVCLVAPGQGAHRPGMLARLPAPGPSILADASEVLGEDACLLAGPESLATTRGAQLALLLTGVAWGRAALDAGMPIAYLAGQSVGMWTVAVLAGSLPFADAVRLVDVRGRAMAAAAPTGSGMIAIDGVALGGVDRVAAELRADGARVWRSNVNAVGAVTASGVAGDLETLGRRLRSELAARVRVLPVAVPAHTPLMEPARIAVREALSAIVLRAPSIPIVANTDGSVLRTGGALARELAESITAGVRWDRGIEQLRARGVVAWIHDAPGRSLLATIPDGDPSIALEDAGVPETAAWARIRLEGGPGRG